MEEEHFERSRGRNTGIWDSGIIFGGYKNEIWERRWRNSQSSRIERVGAEKRSIKEFVQEFRRAARGSRYERTPLVEEFKRGINRTICQKLMELEWQPSAIEQWYNRIIALDRN